MATYVVDGNTKVAFVPTISDTAAPTTAEIGAGTELAPQLTPDGLAISLSEDEVDTSTLNSTFSTTIPGRAKFDIQLTGQMDDTTNTAHDALDALNTDGYLVVRRDGTPESTAWTAADVVEVYPVRTGQISYPTGSANELQTWTVKLYNTSTADLDAVVA